MIDIDEQRKLTVDVDVGGRLHGVGLGDGAVPDGALKAGHVVLLHRRVRQDRGCRVLLQIFFLLILKLKKNITENCLNTKKSFYEQWNG